MIQPLGPADGGEVMSMRMLSGKAQLEEARRQASLQTCKLTSEEKAEIQRRRSVSSERRRSVELLQATASGRDELQAKLARRREASESKAKEEAMQRDSQGLDSDCCDQKVDGEESCRDCSDEINAKLAKQRAVSSYLAPSVDCAMGHEETESNDKRSFERSCTDRRNRNQTGVCGDELQAKLARWRAASDSATSTTPGELSCATTHFTSVSSASGSQGELEAKLARWRAAADSASAPATQVQETPVEGISQPSSKKCMEEKSAELQTELPRGPPVSNSVDINDCVRQNKIEGEHIASISDARTEQQPLASGDKLITELATTVPSDHECASALDGPGREDAHIMEAAPPHDCNSSQTEVGSSDRHHPCELIATHNRSKALAMPDTVPLAIAGVATPLRRPPFQETAVPRLCSATQPLDAAKQQEHCLTVAPSSPKAKCCCIVQ